MKVPVGYVNAAAVDAEDVPHTPHDQQALAAYTDIDAIVCGSTGSAPA